MPGHEEVHPFHPPVGPKGKKEESRKKVVQLKGKGMEWWTGRLWMKKGKDKEHEILLALIQKMRSEIPSENKSRRSKKFFRNIPSILSSAWWKWW